MPKQEGGGIPKRRFQKSPPIQEKLSREFSKIQCAVKSLLSELSTHKDIKIPQEIVDAIQTSNLQNIISFMHNSMAMIEYIFLNSEFVKPDSGCSLQGEAIENIYKLLVKLINFSEQLNDTADGFHNLHKAEDGCYHENDQSTHFYLMHQHLALYALLIKTVSTLDKASINTILEKSHDTFWLRISELNWMSCLQMHNPIMITFPDVQAERQKVGGGEDASDLKVEEAIEVSAEIYREFDECIYQKENIIGFVQMLAYIAYFNSSTQEALSELFEKITPEKSMSLNLLYKEFALETSMPLLCSQSNLIYSWEDLIEDCTMLELATNIFEQDATLLARSTIKKQLRSVLTWLDENKDPLKAQQKNPDFDRLIKCNVPEIIKLLKKVEFCFNQKQPFQISSIPEHIEDSPTYITLEDKLQSLSQALGIGNSRPSSLRLSVLPRVEECEEGPTPSSVGSMGDREKAEFKP